jgi:hypothetical protein
MALAWTASLDTIDWDELSNLYRVAPLGNKKAEDLKVVFTNSMFRCFVYDVYAAPGKDRFYLKLGFKRMLTAMAIFQDQAEAVATGLVADDQ